MRPYESYIYTERTHTVRPYCHPGGSVTTDRISFEILSLHCVSLQNDKIVFQILIYRCGRFVNRPYGKLV